MSASRNLPTIGVNLRGLLLYQQSLRYLQRCMRSVVTCSKQNACHRDLNCIFENLLPCYCYATKANSRTIRSGVLQTVNLTLVQCECHIGKQTVVARNNPTNQN